MSFKIWHTFDVDIVHVFAHVAHSWSGFICASLKCAISSVHLPAVAAAISGIKQSFLSRPGSLAQVLQLPLMDEC